MQYVSHSSYQVSIEAIARVIYYMKQLLSKSLRQIVLKAVSEHKNTGGHAPRLTPLEVQGTTNKT